MSISREALEKYITKGCIWIECGCRWGTTVIRAIEAGAYQAWACEKDPIIAAVAQVQCQEVCVGKPIGISTGDSESFLVEMGAYGIDDPPRVVFLDAHSETHSPVLRELEMIADWSSEVQPQTILIDDLCCMEGWGISYDQLVEAVQKIGDYDIGYEDGVTSNDIMVARLK